MESYNQPMMKPNPKANSGVVKRGYDASIDKTGKLFSRISPFRRSDETVEKTTNSRDNHNNSNTEEKVSNEPSQGTPPNKDNSIVTKNGENFKQSQKKQQCKAE